MSKRSRSGERKSPRRSKRLRRSGGFDIMDLGGDVAPPPIPMLAAPSILQSPRRPRSGSVIIRRPAIPGLKLPRSIPFLYNRRLKRGGGAKRVKAEKNPAWHMRAGKGVPYYRQISLAEARAAFRARARARPRAAMKDWSQRGPINTTYAYVLHPGRYDYPGVDDGSGAHFGRGAKGQLKGYKKRKVAFMASI